MGKSKIEYCDKIWNVTSGCTKVSTGCTNCWAERVFPSIYGNEFVNYPKDEKPIISVQKRKFTDIKLHHDRLDQPLHWKKPQKIFVNSISDLFHEDIPFEFIWEVMQVMGIASQHTYQILTKRPRMLIGFIEWYINRWRNLDAPKLHYTFPENQWLGVSVENQKTADELISIILQIQAKVHWLSLEPILEYINLELRGRNYGIDYKEWSQSIDWVVVGVESGSQMRYCSIGNIESIVEQCKSANVPVFVKQIHLPIPLIKQKSAGKKFYLEKDINKFPKHLQIREYPREAECKPV